MAKIIERRGNVALLEETLTDGSKVYDVLIRGHFETVAAIHARDKAEAFELLRLLGEASITAYDNDPDGR